MPYNKSAITNGDQTQDDELASGLQLTVPENPKRGDYIVDGLNSNVIISIGTNDQNSNAKTVKISFDLEEAKIIKKRSFPYDKTDDDWKDQDGTAFLGFKENQNLTSLKDCEIDTKQMPLLLLTPLPPILTEDDYKKKKQKNSVMNVLEFALTPSIEDNDANVKANFSFDAHAIIGDGEKLPQDSIIESPGLLVNIASKMLGDYIVDLYDADHTFSIKASMNGKAVRLDIEFDLNKAKIIAKTSDLDDNDYGALREGKKAYFKFEEGKLIDDKEIQTNLTPAEKANAKINFSFLLVDSVMIGSSGKLNGSSGKLNGSSGKLNGSSASLPG